MDVLSSPAMRFFPPPELRQDKQRVSKSRIQFRGQRQCARQHASLPAGDIARYSASDVIVLEASATLAGTEETAELGGIGFGVDQD